MTFTEINKPVKVRPVSSLLLIGALNVTFTGLFLYCVINRLLSWKSVTENTFLLLLYIVYLLVALFNE